MRCKGINKSETKKSNKTQYCNTELHEHQIYCHVCGEPTSALKTGLSAGSNFREVWEQHKKGYSQYLGLGLFLSLAVYIPIFILIYLFWGQYWLTNLVMLFSLPFALIPFAQKDDLTVKNYIAGLRHYPRFWVFVLLAELYFFVLKVICTGFLLDIMVDPVLHIVRLIMVIYGIVCAIPALNLSVEKKIKPHIAIYRSIIAGHETRWQQFFVAVQVLLINLAGCVCLFAGLLFTLPLSYRLIRNYYLRMHEYELFDLPNPVLVSE
jgi:hypothetical protein